MVSFPDREITYVFEGVELGERTPEVASDSLVASYIDGLLTTSKVSRVFDGQYYLPGEGAGAINLTDARNSTGEWFGIFDSVNGQDVMVVAGDPFGYQPIFYRQVLRSGGDSALLVSNSFRAICSSAQRLGATNRIHWGEFYSLIGTTHAWSITMQSHQTVESSTRVLLPGQEIIISGGKGALTTSKFFEPGEESYESLVERGVTSAVEQLKSASLMDVDQKRIFLSGGRDSRMAISLLVAAGVVDKYSVNTVNPATWTPASARPGLYRDLYVSNAIREFYGMNWTEPQDMSSVPLSFEQSLEFWQSNRSHRNFRFRAPQALSVSRGSSTEIRGAAGETFRGFQAVKTLNSYGRFGATAESKQDDINMLTSDLFENALLEGEAQSLAKEAVAESLANTGGEDIIESLHRRYSVYRNRNHFGHVRASMATGQIPIFPLSQPEFVQAASLLSEKERYENVMAFDIIEWAAPELNSLEYDSGGYPKTSRFRTKSNNEWSVKDSGRGIDLYYSNEEAARRLRSDAIQSRGKMTPFDARFEAQNRVKELLLDLTHDAEGAANLPYSLQVRIFQMIEGRKLNPLTLVSKLETAREAFGEGSNYRMVVVKRAGTFVDSLPVVRSTVAHLPNKVSQPSFRIGLEVGEDRVRFQITSRGHLRSTLTYVARLLNEGGQVSKVDVGPSGEGTFSGLRSDEDYRIQVFAYYKGRTMVPFKFFSRYFSVNGNV